MPNPKPTDYAIDLVADLQKWRAFVAIGELGSLTRAALFLDSNQSLLSRQLNALERECGARLFNRTGRGVELSEVGLRLFPQVKALLAAAGCVVLRPQPRGMGASSAPPPGMTLHDLADDVARAIAAFGGGRAIVAGHAFGHFVARVTDRDHADRVRGVVVLAGAARVFPPGLTPALDLAADADQPPSARLAALQQAFFAPGHDPSPWLHGWHPQWRAAYRQAATTPDKTVWWPVSHAPILDLQGACDPWRPADTRDELRAVLGEQVTVQVIADASHALPDEQPAAVAAAILSWAGTLPA